MPYTTYTPTSAYVVHTTTTALTVRIVPATNIVISNYNILDSYVIGTVVGTCTATFGD